MDKNIKGCFSSLAFFHFEFWTASRNFWRLSLRGGHTVLRVFPPVNFRQSELGSEIKSFLDCPNGKVRLFEISGNEFLGLWLVQMITVSFPESNGLSFARQG
jgi:hypothetical protein